MMFVLASWASMVLAVVLSWLWLQSVRPQGQGADVACAECHVRATRHSQLRRGRASGAEIRYRQTS